MTADPHRPPPPTGNKLAANAAAATGPDGAGADGSPVLEQEFDAGSLYALRAAVAAHVTHAGMPQPRALDVVLAAHELAINAIRHGAGHGRLLITKHDGALHCQVSDDGKPQATPASAGPQTQVTAPRDPHWPSQHGHGLWVVRQIADHLSVQTGPGGTSATASFILPSPGQEQPAQRASTDTPPAPDQAQPR